MNLNIERQLQFGRAPQSFAQNFFLDFELMFVAGVLVVASAAAAEVGAARLDAVRRRLDDRVGTLRAGEARLLLGEGGLNFFSGEHKWNEDGLAASAGRRQAGAPDRRRRKSAFQL